MSDHVGKSALAKAADAAFFFLPAFFPFTLGSGLVLAAAVVLSSLGTLLR